MSSLAEDRQLLNRSTRYRRLMEFLKIRNENGKIQPMKFSPSQEMLWKYVAPRLDIHERLWFIVLKC